MDQNTVTLLMVAGLITAAVAIWVVWAYFERTKPTRIRKAREGNLLDSSDEAHNSVVTTESIINVMKKRGVDVAHSEILIQRAEMALDAGNHTKALRLSQEARDELDDAKSRPHTPRPVLKKVRRSEREPSDALDELVKLEESLKKDDVEKQEEFTQDREKIRVLPENYMESKFEIDVARGLVRERGNTEAMELLHTAERYFEDEDYTEALKYSIRAKKAVDVNEAGLLAPQKVDRSKKEPPVEDKFTVKPAPEAKTSTGVLSCEECGNPVDETDKFCNQCGGKLEFKTTCPDCGKEVSNTHRFCSNCGGDLRATDYECPECGTEIDTDSKFCPACGVQFED